MATQEMETMYRINLESVYDFIKKRYGDERRVLTKGDVVSYTGHCYKTVQKRFFKKGSCCITAESFARMLAKL